MGDYLYNIAARTLGQAKVIHPRLTPLFGEPMQAPPDTFVPAHRNTGEPTGSTNSVELSQAAKASASDTDQSEPPPVVSVSGGQHRIESEAGMAPSTTVTSRVEPRPAASSPRPDQDHEAVPFSAIDSSATGHQIVQLHLPAASTIIQTSNLSKASEPSRRNIPLAKQRNKAVQHISPELIPGEREWGKAIDRHALMTPPASGTFATSKPLESIQQTTPEDSSPEEFNQGSASIPNSVGRPIGLAAADTKRLQSSPASGIFYPGKKPSASDGISSIASRSRDASDQIQNAALVRSLDAPVSPTINVTIGRIEVRAIPAQTTTKPGRESQPQTSLAQYLHQRGGGEGRE